MGLFEFLIRQVVHEDIWYFWYKIRKGQFLSKSMKDKRKDQAAKLFNKFKHPLQLNILCISSDKKNFCQDLMVNKQNTCCLPLFSQNVPIVMKTKHPVHLIVFEVVTGDGNAMPNLSTYPQTWPREVNKEPGGGSVILDQEDSCHCC